MHEILYLIIFLIFKVACLCLMKWLCCTPLNSNNKPNNIPRFEGFELIFRATEFLSLLF